MAEGMSYLSGMEAVMEYFDRDREEQQAARAVVRSNESDDSPIALNAEQESDLCARFVAFKQTIKAEGK